MTSNIIWYSTKDRLPDDFVSVLVYMPDEAPLPTVHEGYMAENKTWWANGFDRGMKEISHWAEMPTFEQQPENLSLVLEKDNFINALKSENKKGFKDGYLLGFNKGVEETLAKIEEKIESEK